MKNGKQADVKEQNFDEGDPMQGKCILKLSYEYGSYLISTINYLSRHVACREVCGVYLFLIRLYAE